MHTAIYTEVSPATDLHGTEVVARQGKHRVAVPYPYEYSAWEDVHGAAVQALLRKFGANPGTAWAPALFGAGVIWVCNDQRPIQFSI